MTERAAGAKVTTADPTARIHAAKLLEETEESVIPKDQRDAEFISVEEWGRRVGLSARSAYRAVKNNEVPGVYRTGRRIVVNWPAFVASTYDAA